MGRKKNMYLVIDTETANGLDDALPYDIGYAICDRLGNISVKRSFVVAEIFLEDGLMDSAYYAQKRPIYWDDLKSGKRVMKSIFNIRKQIHADIKEYGVNTIAAYNMSFDKRALNNDIRYCSKSFLRWFFPYGMKYICIWHMACQTILNRNTFVNFALKNGFVSEAGNIQTSAEVAYRYMTKQPEFVESHTGLEDVEIEVEIMAKCFATHRAMKQEINRLCWEIPQKKRAEMGV